MLRLGGWALPALPAFEEAFGEVFGAGGGPCVDFVRGHPEAGFDFRGGPVEGLVGAGGEEFDEFHACAGAGWDGGGEEETVGGGADAEFFFEFADGAGEVGFAGVEVACGAAVPFAWHFVFEVGTLLEEDLACGVEDEDVDGAVTPAVGVDEGAGGGGGDDIVFVDDVEDLVVALGGRGVVAAPCVGEGDPLGDGEFLTAGGGIDVGGGGDDVPWTVVAWWEEIAEHFPALGEARAEEVVDGGLVEGREIVARARCEDDDSAIDFGARDEDVRREFTDHGGVPAELGADAEEPAVGGAGGGAETVADLLLEREDGALDGARVGEPAADDFGADRVGEGSDELERLGFEVGAEVEVEGVAVDDGDTGERAVFGADEFDDFVILFEEDEVACGFDEVGGEGSHAWADFDDGVFGGDFELVDDP